MKNDEPIKRPPTKLELDRNLVRNPVPVHQGFLRMRIGELPVSYDPDYDYQHHVDNVAKAHTAPPPETVNANIQNFTVPGMGLNYAPEAHYKFTVQIPTTEDNEYTDNTISCTMLCDDYYENYWAIHRYMETIQSGQTDAFPILDKNHRVYGYNHRYRNRLTWIPHIDVHFGDDRAQHHMIIRYYRCYPTSLANLSITPGSISPITFNVSFNYQFKKIIRLPDPNKLMSAICVITGGETSGSYGS